MTLTQEIQRVKEEAVCLYNKAEVSEAIERMAATISDRLASRHPLLLSVLNGGIFITAELALRLNFPLEIDCVKAGRYQGATQGSEMIWGLEPTISLHNRCVLIVDDILDEGITLSEIARFCREKGASEVLTAVLVDKRLNKPKPITADFVGLETENLYLFGYGLDYKNHLRNCAGIFACTHVY